MYTILSVQYITANSIKGCQATIVEFTIIRIQAFKIRIQAFKVRIQAFKIRIQAFKIRIQAFKVRMQALKIRIQAFKIRIQARQNDGTYQSLCPRGHAKISWKISRAGTPRKLNVVELSSVSARTKADRKRSD